MGTSPFLDAGFSNRSTTVIAFCFSHLFKSFFKKRVSALINFSLDCSSVNKSSGVFLKGENQEIQLNHLHGKSRTENPQF
jgi:hypothetical protein